MGFTTHELEILETTSRVGSVFSLLGASFIITTFCTCKDFHRPINRLAFYASFGNIATNVGTMMSRDGIRSGVDTPTCQIQALIMQWMIPADALFCLAMAWNVYLTVFKKRTTSQLRQLEPYYIGLCYGLPLIIALTFLFYKPPNKPRIFGNATLWCWISPDWQYLRIAAFYGPIWVVLTITFMIYLLAGRIIFNLRRSLRKFAYVGSQSISNNSNISNHTFTNSQNAPRLPEKAASSPPDSEAPIELARVMADNVVDAERGLCAPGLGARNSYSCTVEVSGGAKGPSNGRSRSRVGKRSGGNTALEANSAAWAYCRCAMLFFLALVITWLPSSINRVHSLQQPHSTDFSYNFAAALVLPCQGFWNGMIYIVTTLPACKKYFRNIWAKMKGPMQWCGMRKHQDSDSIRVRLHSAKCDGGYLGREEMKN